MTGRHTIFPCGWLAVLKTVVDNSSFFSIRTEGDASLRIRMSLLQPRELRRHQARQETRRGESRMQYLRSKIPERYQL